MTVNFLQLKSKTMKRFIPILFAVSLAHAAGAPSRFVMTDTNGVLALPSTFISSNAAAIAAALPLVLSERIS